MANINDVARVAGVSISTVSYALSGKRAISDATRARIDAAVRELGYRPHAGARMLAGARTNILALSAPLRADGHLPTHMRFVTAVVEAAREHDYDVLLLATDDEVNGIRRVADSSLVDGVVLMGVGTDDERADLVRSLRLPAGFIGVPADTTGITCIDLDFERAARESVRRLAAEGHRAIGMIGHPHTYFDRHTGFIQRFTEAFDDECALLGIRTSAQWPQIGKPHARAAVDELRAQLPEMTALVFHCNEPVVEAALAHLAEQGVSIPGDLSVLAAAASYATDELEPPLSAVPLPLETMCRGAVENTMRAIESGGADVVSGVEFIAPTYVDRGSIAAPRASVSEPAPLSA